MRLSQDILHYRLLLDEPVLFSSKNDSDARFTYPILFESGADLSDHVVVIGAEDLEALLDRGEASNALFVCVGKTLKPRQDMPSVILIGDSVSLVHVNNDLARTFDEFENWDYSLKNVIRASGSFQDLINCCEPVLTDPISITDKEFNLIAASRSLKEAGSALAPTAGRSSPENFSSVIAESDRKSIYGIRDFYLIPSAGGRILCRNLLDQEEFVGRVSIRLSTDGEALQKYCRAVLEHFYVYVVLLYGERASYENRDPSGTRLATLLRNALSQKRIPEKLWEEAFKENGWDVNGPYALIQFVPNPLFFEENSVKATYTYVQEYKADNPWNESLCFVYMEHTLLFVNLEKSFGVDHPDLTESIADFSKKHFLIAGASRVFIGMEHLRAAYDQTQAAIEFGAAHNPADSCYIFNDYALDYMLHHCIGVFDNREICSHKLASLRRYDKKNGTDYFNTLYIYFKCRFNAAEAAKKLFINRSTFHYRLQRIQELVYIDFDSEDERLYLEISFKIMEH